MSEKGEVLTLGEEAARHAALSAFAYYEYVWLLHVADFPEDFKATEERMEVDPKIIQEDLEFWSGISQEQHSDLLLRKMVQIVGRASREVAKSPTAVKQGSDQHIDFLTLYISEITRPLAMKMVEDEPEIYAKNQHLQFLGNPLSDRAFVKDIWGYIQDRRKHRSLGKYATFGHLAPGYLENSSTS